MSGRGYSGRLLCSPRKRHGPGRWARLSGLSALAAGRRVPDGEIWEGSPARQVDRTFEALPPRPQVGRAARLAQIAFFAAAGMAVAAMFFMTIFPSFMLIDWMDAQLWDLYENEVHPLYAFGLFLMLGIPASMVLVLATVLLAAGLRKLFLRRQEAGLSSVYGLAYCRKWLLTRVLDCSLSVLHGLYASVFAPAWLRLMGAKVGAAPRCRPPRASCPTYSAWASTASSQTA